jgi:hypothetical protein
MSDSKQLSVQLHDSGVDLISTTLDGEGPTLHTIGEFAENQGLKQLASGMPGNVVVSIKEASVLLKSLMGNGQASFNLLPVAISMVYNPT